MLRSESSQPATPETLSLTKKNTGQRARPLSQKTLTTLHRTLLQTIDQALTTAIEVRQKSPSGKPPDPLSTVLSLRPVATFDPETLKRAECQHIPFLASVDDATTIAQITAYAESKIPEIAASKANTMDAVAANIAQRITRQCLDPDENPNQYEAFPQKPLQSLWALAHPGEPFSPEWTLLIRGTKGDAARARAKAEALAKAQQDEAWHETHVLELSPFDQADRRANYAYKGPPLGWSPGKLQQIWSSRSPDRPMPRSWRAIADDVPPMVKELADSEAYLLDSYRGACDALRDQIAAAASDTTQRRRQTEAQNYLSSYVGTCELTASSMRNAGIDPPPAQPHEPLPPTTQDTRPRGTPTSQQTLTIPEVTIVPPRARPKSITPPRRPQGPPASQPLQLSIP